MVVQLHELSPLDIASQPASRAPSPHAELAMVPHLRGYDEQKCDKRILMRLSTLIASEKGNVYQTCFLPTEIEGLRCILQTCAGDSAGIKVAMAKFYQRQNNNSIFLPHKQLANLLRPDYVLDSADQQP